MLLPSIFIKNFLMIARWGSKPSSSSFGEKNNSKNQQHR